MAKQRLDLLQSEDKFENTAMIDVVFLLLIYFMFLPIQQEADLSITLPAETQPTEDIDLPNEAIIDIFPNAMVHLNGAPVDSPGSRNMPDLVRRLQRGIAASEQVGVRMVVIINADPDSPHQRTVDVMNACAAAGIRLVSFAFE